MSLDISIAPFVKPDEITDQREVWPSQGMAYEVDEVDGCCGKSIFIKDTINCQCNSDTLHNWTLHSISDKTL